MKKSILFILSAIFFLIMAVSCQSGKEHTESTVGNSSNASDTSEKNIIIEVNEVDSMVFIPIEGQPLLMDQTVCKPLSEYLYKAIYNTHLNQSGIMIKMQAPDYTVVFYYKDKNPEESDWLMIWKEDGRTKFGNEWYYLDDNTQNNVYEILDGYVSKSTSFYHSNNYANQSLM